MKIFIDWDSVVLNTGISILINWNLLHPDRKLPIMNSNQIDWNFENVLEGTDITLPELFKIFDYEHFYNNCQLIDGSVESIKRLIDNKHKVIILSKHDTKRKPITGRFIHKLFGNKVRIKYVDNFEDKAKIKGDVLIDDKPESLIGSIMKLPILFGNYKWNKDSDLKYRGYSWNQIMQVFEFCGIVKRL